MSILDDALDVGLAFKLAQKQAPLELKDVGDVTVIDVSAVTDRSGFFLLKGPQGARYRVRGLELERER